MARTSWILLTGLLLSVNPAGRAADGTLGGTWKVLLHGQESPVWLIKLESQDGKFTGSMVATAEDWQKDGTIEEVRADSGHLRFTANIEGQVWTFEGKLPAQGSQKIGGSFDVSGYRTFVAELERTSLKSLDSYEVAKDVLAAPLRSETGVWERGEVFDAALTLLRQAEAKKARPEEVRGWAEKAFKRAGQYGDRWQREMALRFATVLVNQAEFTPVALEYARRAERLLDPQVDPDSQVRTLSTLALALKKAQQLAEAKEIQARIGKLEVQAHQVYSKRIVPFSLDSAGPRKGKSDRVVLVELFTGTQCPPCVAADVGFDGLGKTYKPVEVVLLQYHLHIPGPDPLTNPDAVARGRYYDPQMGTPTTYFSGEAAAAGGGSLGEAREKYQEYRDVIDAMLEKAAKARLRVSAVRKGETVEITAEVTDLAGAGEETRLRVALVEEWVRYAGPNGMRYHEHVVRAMPGGAAGFALKNKDSKQVTTVDLRELRNSLNKYLDEFAKGNEFPDERPSLDLPRLHVIAFVQNDATKEVLQAVRAEVQSSGQ